MVKLTHNLSKFNSRVINIKHNIKHNGFSAPDLLLQLFPAYLVCLDKQFHDYIVEKRNKFEEGTVMRPDYLIKCASYKYKTLLDKG